ncbi:DRIM domain-containing protein [Mycena sanguinolenta]|uniref:DRIM domain-containing protein n=1 Tax=Mycena sanguinolenta TaxID=230812 RepID=A0A8H6ZDH8_9AGAR|nr:DRIM domain-containing protein [Mycena sanguinolenta]
MDKMDAPPAKRFKHQSYSKSLKEVHLPSALSQTPLDDLEDHESHFYASLEHWQQLNLAPAFIKFVQKAGPLSASMPLLLHNWAEIMQLWIVALDDSDDEGLPAVLDLLQKITHDLRMTLSPVYLDPVLPRLLALLLRSKTISAPALTALLATFAALFKFLLIPASSSTELELLEKSWTCVRDILPRCLPEVQRAMAEVWGGVLRRLKSEAKEKAVVLLAESVVDQSAGDVQDAVAWCAVYACKSVSQTLHTCTPSIILPLLNYHLSAPPSSSADPTPKTYTLLRRLFTALIHHVRSAENFTSIGDVLVNKFISLAQGTAPLPDDLDTLRRMMDLISIPASVRNGSRLTQKHAAALIAAFPSLLNIYLAAPSPHIRAAALPLATALLTASPEANPAFWMSHGRELLDIVWNNAGSETAVSFAISLTGSLAELGWAGWRAIGVPVLLRMTCKIISAQDGDEDLRRRTMGLIAELWRTKKLGSGDGDVVWRNCVESWSVKKLREMASEVSALSWDQVTLLTDILSISSLFSQSSGFSPVLVGLCEALLSSDNTQSSAQRRPVQAALELENLELARWVRTCTTLGSQWAASAEILEALAALVTARNATEIEIEEIYPALAPAILSHSRALRLGALRLLAATRPSDTREVVKRCLAGEEVPLEVQGVRERVLRIGRVETVVKDKQRETDIGPDVCGRWLVAQLKINLRPLWSPAAGALAQMAQRFGDEIWRMVFEELKALYSSSPANDDMQVEQMDEKQTGKEDDDPWEEERTWRDPSAHKLRSVIGKWLNARHRMKELADSQNRGDRLDVQTYESQLLFALGECPALPQKHHRDIVPFFLDLASSSPDTPSKLPRHKLTAWLTLFSKIPNPMALSSSNALRGLYIANLSHPDRALQSVALSCILTYKSPRLAAYEPQMRAFLDDTRLRDELSRLELAEVEPQHRGEVVDIITRLLFGLMLEKRNRSRGHDRRAAILGVLAGCTDEELGLLVDLMLRSLKSDKTSRQEQPFSIQDVPADVSEKQQIGFIGLLRDVMRHLGPRLVQYWPALLGTTIDLVARAQTLINSPDRADEEQENDVDDEEDIEEPSPTASASRILRSIRQHGLKRIVDFFRCPAPFDYTPYMQAAFAAFISPRLASLDRENTQAPSGLMELFHVWTLDRDRVMFLVQFDDQVLPKVYDCLVATSVKPAVVSKIFDIVEKLLAFSTVDSDVCDRVVKPHVSLLLNNLATLVERTKGTAAVSSPLGQRQITILSEIAQYSTDASQASTLLALFNPLLRKPPKVVPEKVKVDLLNIIGTLMPLIPDLSVATSEIYVKMYELLSQLFQSLRSRPARISLVGTFRRLSLLNTSLEGLAQTLDSLNAYSTRRMDEPDFDRRLAAFAALNETLFKSLSLAEWLPVIYSMLHSIQDPAELTIRTNAAFTMRHFVDLVATRGTPEFETMFTRVLFSGLKNGLRSKNELVRSEILGVIAYAVTKCESISFLQEMRVLLAGGDEEANFFNNIHHIQIHRRSRALRRLADQCDEGHLRSNTLAEIFVPLVGNYITVTSSLDHLLVNEAILTTGRMAKHLAWGAYYALVQKYLRLSRAKDASERVYVRTLVSLLDNFHFPMEQAVPVEAVDEVEPEDADAEEDIPAPPIVLSLHSTARIADAVNLRLLPDLLNHLEKHDPTTEDTTRIPIAIGIVKVAKHLPATAREPQISRLLTVLSQVLRSRSQETRDLTRDTLCRIAVTLGPSYLPLMLREMRAALLRGPQLHVLAYVTHALLVHVSSDDHSEAFGTLDDCVNDVAYVSAEVIFGESAKDVLSEEFKTKMREVRSSSAKGLDSFGIIAKYVTPPRISSLLVPLRAIMQETESVKVIQLVDDVLKRVTSGLNANKHLIPTELLVLCHTLISQNAKFLKQTPMKRKGPKGDAIVQLKRQVAEETDHYATNSFRFVTFGLDLFSTALRRNRLDFHDPEIIKRLETMVVVIGNTLYSSSSPVLVFGLRAAAGIIKCPPQKLGEIASESELVQVALKSLATMLRDGPPVQVKEKDLVYLLELLTPDLEEPSRQASVFAMLRAIVARKFVVPEIYDVMDKVADIMVTTQSPQVQELCRSVLLQFLLDYPQGKGRLRNQMSFLAKNLSYEYESGRKSVLELLGAVLAKFEAGLVREYVDLLFVALVMVVANDDSTKCREMAAQLIKTLFSRLDDERRRVILSHLHSWASQSGQPQLTRVSSQVYGLIVDVMEVNASAYLPGILEDVHASLERSSQQLAAVENNEEDSMDVDPEWQAPYHSLILLSKCSGLQWWPICSFPTPGYGQRPADSSARYLPPFPPAPPQGVESSLSGLKLKDVAAKLCTQLKSEHLDEALSLQVVKNLFYIGKCFYAIPFSTPEQLEAEQSDDEEAAEDNKDLNPLPWLFSKLSYQIRSAHIARRNRSFSAPNWSQQPLAVLRWFAAMAAHMDAPRLEMFLVHILTPTYRLAEDDTIRDSQMDELKTVCIELQDLVQSKVGTTKFSATYNQIRQSVLGVQRERKAAKVLQVTVNPEAAAKRKLQRNSLKKESKKRKSSAFADNKGRIKRRRDE